MTRIEAFQMCANIAHLADYRWREKEPMEHRAALAEGRAARHTWCAEVDRSGVDELAPACNVATGACDGPAEVFDE